MAGLTLRGAGWVDVVLVAVLVVGGCGPTAKDVPGETDDPPDSSATASCAEGAEAPVLTLRPYTLPEGCEGRGDLAIGTPPPGGAPFLPVRPLLDLAGHPDVFRVAAEGVATTPEGDAVAMESTTVSALCANAGPDAGQYVLGEVHLRFPEGDATTLDGVDVTVSLTVSWEGGGTEATVSGTTCWGL